MPDKKIIVVLGMHRSGTSALARGIVALGAHPGNHLLPENEGNEKGYWENADIVALNDRILKSVGMRWHSLDNPLLNRFALLLPLYDSFFLDEAKTIITENLRSSDLLMIKDPRVSILLPFWQKVFEELHVTVKYVIALRNPLEVAKSLQKRNGMSIDQGIRLWFYYNYMILKNVKNEVLVCSFSSLMENPRKELERICAHSEVQPVSDREIDAYCNEFLEKSLKHHNDDDQQFSEYSGQHAAALDLYKMLKSWALKNKIDASQPEKTARQMEEAAAGYLGYTVSETIGNDLRDNYAQIFVDYGNGFSEQDSFKYNLEAVINHIELTAEQLRQAQKLRLDPSRYDCILVLDSVIFKKDDQQIPIEKTRGNYQFHFGNVYIFEQDDPQIWLFPGEDQLTGATFRFTVYRIDVYTLLMISRMKHKKLLQMKTQRLHRFRTTR